MEEEVASIVLTRHNICVASKRHLSSVESPLVESTNASSSGRCLLKSRNMDFLLGEATLVFEIPNDDILK